MPREPSAISREANASDGPPLFSIIIPVHNDWRRLRGCLQSLVVQEKAPNFEVIIVDDGSSEAAPESIRNGVRDLALMLVRLPHAGISVARNLGIRLARGDVLLFTDADCRLRPNCLSELSSLMADVPEESCFQLHLEGDNSSIVGQAEQLRLSVLQSHKRETQFIRYLNTAGFAIRRNRAANGPLFEPLALRGEDTLLLANLMQQGELPYFVSGATIRHDVSLSFFECLMKDIRSARLEAPVYARMKSSGVRVRSTQMERLQLLRAMWKGSKGKRAACAALICRRLVRRSVGSVWRILLSFHNTWRTDRDDCVQVSGCASRCSFDVISR